MTSDDIFNLIEQVAAEPGKNAKIALLAAHSGDTELKEVLQRAYHPLVTYGVRKLVMPAQHGQEQFERSVTLNILDALASRTLSGNAALERIKGEEERLTPKSAALLRRIILKDMRAGFDAETVNKVWKGLVPDFPYMRCSLPKHVKVDEFFKDGAISQVKADGTYTSIDLTDDGEVRLRTRQGNEYPLGPFRDLVTAVRAFVCHGSQLHGELLLLRDGEIVDRADGNGVFGHVRQGGDFADEEVPLFLAWDQIPLEVAVPKGKLSIPYDIRLQELCDQLLETRPAMPFKDMLVAPQRHPSIGIVESCLVDNLDEAIVHYRANLARGMEGSVVKKRLAIWKDGTSREQIKLKLKVPFEVRVKGFEEGTGKNVDKYSKLVCHSECGQVIFNVACRGDAMIDEVTAHPERWLETVITVDGNGVQSPSDSNPNHSIFLPIFVERRDDKSRANTLEEIREQFDHAVNA